VQNKHGYLAGALAAGNLGRSTVLLAGGRPAGGGKADIHIGLCTYMVGAKMDLPS
jgi:hypothetical protein